MASEVKQRFEISGYYFIALAALALWGFWPNYFYKFFYGTPDFKFDFHFLATVIALWVASLIVQLRAATFFTSNFFIRFLRWVSIVKGLTKSSSAISMLGFC